MKKFLLFTCLSVAAFVHAQVTPSEYKVLIKKADSLYNVKAYKNSAYTYSDAFKSFGWKGYPDDRYNAACSWAMAGVPDSALFNLERISSRGLLVNYKRVASDSDLVSLYNNPRWATILSQVKLADEKVEAAFDRPLMARLDSVYRDDQDDRVVLMDLQKKFGTDSKEVRDQWKTIGRKDSVNEIKVKQILDTRGWLGPDVVGEDGNTALFLVIQHSNQATQEKYLPMMRGAVKNGKARGSSLALLEDRVALGQGKKQIYGSQIATGKDNKYYVMPLEDPDHVDERRKSVGLPPLAKYVENWNMEWDVEAYKKELPEIEAYEKERREGRSKKEAMGGKQPAKTKNQNRIKN